MKIFMIGGTGLLGSEGARELLLRGHKVKSISLPPVPTKANIPKEMELSLGNYLEMTDKELKEAFYDCEGFVFAAGVDERVEGEPPIYNLYYKYNIEPVKRLLTIAKECGVKHVVILGSYFSYFHKKWPELELAKHHAYIRSRIDQEKVALGFADETMDVAILELPYIFGAQPGRKPVWMFLAKLIMQMKFVTMYPPGGTTMVTVKQVAQCIAGALENNRGGKTYPVGFYNLTWKEMLQIMHKGMGQGNKKVLTVPKFTFALAGLFVMIKLKLSNHESGLSLVKFTKVMCSNTFIDKQIIVDELGVIEDNIEDAIIESMVLCRHILNNKQDVVDMKAE